MAVDFLEERPETAYYDTYNNDAALWEQNRLILDSVLPVFGEAVEPAGIAVAAYGKLNTGIGRVLKTDQIEAGVTGMLRNDPVYMAPGAGGLHDVADDRDYCVGKLTEDQGTKTYIVFQTVDPFAVESET